MYTNGVLFLRGLRHKTKELIPDCGLLKLGSKTEPRNFVGFLFTYGADVSYQGVWGTCFSVLSQLVNQRDVL